MSFVRFVASIVLAVLLSCPCGAQDGDGKFVFPTQPDVVIRLKKSSKPIPIRGRLESLSKLEAVVIDDRGERKRVSFDRIDSLKTANLEFKGSDDFSEISQKVVSAYSSVQAVSGATSAEPHLSGPALPGSAEESQRKANTTPPKNDQIAKNGLGQGGFGGIGNIPKPGTEATPAPSVPAESHEATPAKPLPGSAEAGATTMDVYLCDKCKKEITGADLRRGACPHCKTDFQVALPATPAGTNPFGQAAANGAAPGNPFAKQGQGQPAAAPAPVPAPNGGAAPPVVIQGGGDFTFDSIPNWAKGGLFVLLVLVGYHVTFNR